MENKSVTQVGFCDECNTPNLAVFQGFGKNLCNKHLSIFKMRENIKGTVDNVLFDDYDLDYRNDEIAKEIADLLVIVVNGKPIEIPESMAKLIIHSVLETYEVENHVDKLQDVIDDIVNGLQRIGVAK